MDPVITPILVTAALATAGVAAGVTTVGAAVVSVAATAAAAGVSYFTSKSASKGQTSTVAAGSSSVTESTSGDNFAKAQQFSVSQANSARELVVRQPLPPRRKVYGECRVGGPLFFQDVSSQYLYLGIAITEGASHQVLKIFMGEYEVVVNGSGDAITGNRYVGRFKCEFALGSDTQAVSTLLSGTFPSVAGSNFRQRGVTRGVFRFDWGADSEQHNFLWSDLSPAVLGQWLKVYDPREVSHDFNDSTTWEYSDNPALCVAHLLTTWWRSPLPFADLDWDSVAEAADDCDALITVQGASRKTFVCAGVVESNIDLASQLSEMLSSFGGSVSYYDGQYHIHADKARTAVVTFTDEDLLGIESYDCEAEADNLFNAIKGIYQSSQEVGRTTATRIIDLPDAQVTEGVVETALSLPFTPQDHCAQILAYRHMLYARDGRVAVFAFTDAAAGVRPPDVFTISSASFPWLNGQYQVMQIDMAGAGFIVTARRYLSAAYADPSTYVI